MDVKPGYKQTEVGVIPEDWEIGRLGEYLVAPPDYGINAPAVPHSDSLPRYIRITDITDDGRYSKESIVSVESPFSSRYLLNRGDLVFARTGASVGKTYLYDPDDGELVFAGYLIRVRPFPDKLDSRFLASWVNTALYWNWVKLMSTRTGQPGINGTEFSQLPLPVPTLAEQQAIAEALSDVDALINALDRPIAKKRAIKQGAMQELLTGRRRLPEFGGEWQDATLGQLGKCHRGVSYNPGTDLSDSDTASTFRLLRSTNVQEAKVALTDLQFVDSSRVSEIQRLRREDVLICMANGSKDLVGKAAKFSVDDGFEYTFGAFMGCFRPNEQGADPDFVFYLFQTEKYRTHVSILLAGSSINNLRPSDLEALCISIPTDGAEQTAIAAILSDMDAEIAALERRRDKTRLLKQGMMQELLTGRIRLV